MKIKSMIEAELNVDIIQGVILSFLSGFDEKCSYDLLLIATSFVFSKECRESLSNANKKSTMQSIFLKSKLFNNDINKLVLWANISQRIEILKDNFNLALIELSSRKMIHFEKMITSNCNLDYSNYNDIIKSYFRASYYLGIIMKKCDSNDIINSVLRRI